MSARGMHRPASRPGALGAVALAALLCSGCALFGDDKPKSTDLDQAIIEAEQMDLALRVKERMARSERYGEGELFLEIERLMPAWQAEQRHGRAEAVEARLTQEVVTHFDMVVNALRNGSHERRLVAAWALGFSRVPANSAGVVSPHPQAVVALVEAMPGSDDDVMCNILVALWRIDDAQTPIEPLVEVLALHHDAVARSNAALALSELLTRNTLPLATDTVVVALGDVDPKVRLHATNVPVRFPQSVFTAVLILRLPDEPMPLVRARMAEALGRSGDRSAGRVIAPLLDRGDAVERALAHQALVTLYGVDRGVRGDDWRDLVAASN